MIGFYFGEFCSKIPSDLTEIGCYDQSTIVIDTSKNYGGNVPNC